ncbi:MAG: hypothetical protein IKO07_03470 [Clostridia bacterium]|nr:hypothetical protein [Clostridia bacterium]
MLRSDRGIRGIGVKASLIIVCLLLFGLPALAAANLLVNPDWENGMVGWVVEANNAAASRDGETLVYSSIYQDVPLSEVAGGQKLILSADLKAEAFQKKIEMGLIICKADGSRISDLMESESGNEWKYHEIVTAIPSDAAYARVSLTIWKDDDSSSFGFDNLSLTTAQTYPGGQKENPFSKANTGEQRNSPSSQDERGQSDADSSVEEKTWPDNLEPSPDDQGTAAQATEVYTFIDRNGVEYAAPVDLFAARVIDIIPGQPWAYYEANQNPENALGLPDYDESPDTSEYCLGSGGTLVVAFDKALYDGPGPDLYIFETGGAVEDTRVEVSDDLVFWYDLGTASGSHGDIEMSGIVPAGSSFRYVRLTDVSHTGGHYPGADIDALCGFYGKAIAQDAAPDETDRSAVLNLPPYYSNFNIYAVQNEPEFLPDFTVGNDDIVVKCISTYHWNNGRGATPGEISLFDDDGMCLGTWDAVGRSGSGAENVYWDVFPNITLKAGSRYYVGDSSTATWSHNSGSDDAGFIEIRAVEAVANTVGANTNSLRNDPQPHDFPIYYSNYNSDPTSSHPEYCPGFKVENGNILLEAVTTYHWNGGKGMEEPGTISLYDWNENCLGSW